jgi:membrane associated rhomboid family serine protease
MGLQDRDYYPELSDDESWRGPKQKKPLAITTILIFICVAVSIADLVTSQSPDPSAPRSAAVDDRPQHPLINLFALSTQPRDLIYQPYRILTYGFTHSPLNGRGNSALHLIFNMIGLYFFGNYCEQLLGRMEFLRFYLAAVIFAGAVYMGVGFSLSELSYVVGASGALLACLVFAAWKRPKDRVLLYGVWDVPLWGLAVGYVGMDIFGAVGRVNSNTAFTCHLGGALFATLYYQLRMNFEFLNFARWGTWKRQMTTRRNLKVHSETTELEDLAGEADRLLQKIQDQGVDSLSKRERELLERYSRDVSNKRKRRD